jgi:DNA-binding response OmpR family regulator
MTIAHAPARLLLCSDAPTTAGWMLALVRSGHDVATEARREQVVPRLLRDCPDLVVVDLALCGAELARRILDRHRGGALFLVGSAADPFVAEVGEARCVASAADDSDLVAAVRRALESLVPQRVTLGPMVLDGVRRTAFVGDCDLVLTGTEFEVLWVLASRAGEIVSRETLHALALALGTDFSAQTRAIDVHVSRIRRRLAEAGATAVLRSVRARGYTLRPAPPR